MPEADSVTWLNLSQVSPNAGYFSTSPSTTSCTSTMSVVVNGVTYPMR